MKALPALTDQEIEILRQSRDEPSIFTDYFFRPIGGDKGWRFDDNFTPDGVWQRSFALAAQKDIIISSGIGAGKTTTVGMAACWMASITHPDFKFLNVAPTTYQAAWMYDYILRMSVGTPFERLIFRSPSKPYPLIELRFKVHNVLVSSLMLFMSIDKNAKNIFTFEGDWINIEEAGLIDNLEEVMVSIGTRLRGSFRGRERIGRLSLISNPWENPYFWYMFDLAEADPENSLSMYVSTRANKNVTDAQLEKILRRIHPSEHERFILGLRPEGRGNYFSKEAIRASEDTSASAVIEKKTAEKEPGYEYNRSPGVGVDYFTMPRYQDDDIMIFGDPGTKSAPGRDAPVVFVFRVKNFPKEPARLIAAWWGNGEGSIIPWAYQLGKFIEAYRPIFVGVDSTGPQKSTNELLNTLLTQIDEDGSVNLFGQKFKFPPGLKIAGFDFSGEKKSRYLVSAQFFLEARLFCWPSFFHGLKSQLGNYDPSKDRGSLTKVPQDLVGTISIAAFSMRRWFYIDPSQYGFNDDDSGDLLEQQFAKSLRLDSRARSRRAKRNR